MSHSARTCFGDVFRDARVLVTGHTGFKGSWLTRWLVRCGAEVHGLGLDPDEDATLFDSLRLADILVSDQRSDIRDADLVARRVATIRPRFVFHLAAQPLVRLSYREPLETFQTNVLGTANLLDALRRTGDACSVVIVTTDKCYQNRGWTHGYRECDRLGGHDPYSASKAAAELITASFRDSFFRDSPVRVASARAGNVIGGGDWAADRLVPDCIRALAAGRPIEVRNRTSTRPWQHVLEPLSGYLHLAARLATAEPGEANELASGFNFGPSVASNRTVLELVREIVNHWPGPWIDASDPDAVHEATLLHLSTDKAHHQLHWHPVWDFATTIEKTVAWYRADHASDDVSRLTDQQIDRFVRDAAKGDQPWADPKTKRSDSRDIPLDRHAA